MAEKRPGCMVTQTVTRSYPSRQSSKIAAPGFVFSKIAPILVQIFLLMEIAWPAEHGEEGLIKACVRRERWAQQVLYEEYYGKMLGVCHRYAGNEYDALDILHEGFIKVFKNVGKFQPGTSLSAWMRKIMVNTAIDYYRKNLRARSEEIDQATQVSVDDADAVSLCSQQEILAAIQFLTPVYRTVFNLYVVEGYSHKEIADLLDITESTSRSNLVKARLKLKELLMSRNYDENGSAAV
jgi:RNA polymerase sigma factor (sigma-70 family)